MNYRYYPGCSLEGSAREYDISTRAVMAALGVELQELEGWTCCGASAAGASSRLLSLVLPARNLALAEGSGGPQTLMVPCSACYLNLRRVTETIRSSSGWKDRINEALAVDGLSVNGTVSVRHLLDILSQDIGAAGVKAIVRKPLSGLRVAPYYGCQCLRPYPVFDDPELPTSMEPIIEATGASVFPWHMAGACCGASHINTHYDAALVMIGGILEDAAGADAVVTVCPMCQLNLEAFQHRIHTESGRRIDMPILYLPQLIGLAAGLSPRELGLGLNLSKSLAVV
ncbi:MAG: CoB--CoM heterodisulfide reductase iron-sulfur subunit B family protein [Thermodesulfobacteriota bacterium]